MHQIHHAKSPLRDIHVGISSQTSIHKFQGLEAGFDKYDQIKHVIVDLSQLKSNIA